MNFHPPFSEPPSSSCPSNIEITFDFSYIITKIHPPFQNPRSALVLIVGHSAGKVTNALTGWKESEELNIVSFFAIRDSINN